MADLGIVGVEDDGGLGGQRRDRLAPPSREQLELTVAVELVAEQVAEADGPWTDPAHHLGEGGLVDLEQAELRMVGREQCRGDAREQVRPGTVVGEPQARVEDLRRHRGGRRLPVRRRDRDRAGGKARGEPVDRAGVDGREQLSRDRGAAAGADEA